MWHFVMGYNKVANNDEYKLYTNGQQMKVYMLTIYIIHVEHDDIMLSHHLELDVVCDFTYATNGILVVHVGCNFIFNCKFFKNYSEITKTMKFAISFVVLCFI